MSRRSTIDLSGDLSGGNSPRLSRGTGRRIAPLIERPGGIIAADPNTTRPLSSPNGVPPLLFEVAWEVCWQLGGIYTVLKTKAHAMLRRWGEGYFAVGPYNPATAVGEFEETPPPDFIHRVFEQLRDEGIKCHYGNWLIPGKPKVVLLDYRSRHHRLHEDKYLLFADHGIATPPDDGELNDCISFGFVVAEFFKRLMREIPEVPTVVHCHEWMGGVCIPRIRHEQTPVTTVFTTHATLLGRYLAGDNPYFYDHLQYFNADAEADKYRILPRHQLEKAAAHASHVFTTVSEITRIEAEKLLGRPPDYIVPNGIDVETYEAPHDLQHFHNQFKEQIHQFTIGHFFPSYPIDLNNTLYLFLSGRYEYTNKGIDLYLESLYRLNEKLKREPNSPTVVAFIVTRASVRGINGDVLATQAQLDQLHAYCDAIKEDIARKLFMATATGRAVQRGELIDSTIEVTLKRHMAAMKRYRQPSVVTHDVVDDANDPILKHLRHRHLLNAAHDRVKVVYHPQFMSSISPLMSLDYDQFVRGCHLGVFPSYYEPWGYTPVECIARGIPAVTSDLSGFGAYVQGTMPGELQDGLHVLKRRGKSFDAAADDLAGYLFNFAKMDRRARIEQRNKVERMAERFGWNHLITFYHDAHDRALQMIGQKSGSITIKQV
jgi:glycogen synthase